MIAEELRREGLYPELLTEDYISKLERSAPLHDIGKIKISDLILNKPGKLTAEEFDEMKTHTLSGREILQGVVDSISDISYLADAMDMATYHHERWDGDGYPAGLDGEEIPLSARIMAVADVFDALVSQRSYKEALPAETAEDIIEKESGTHFDPTVVAAFKKAFNKMKDIAKN